MRVNAYTEHVDTMLYSLGYCTYKHGKRKHTNTRIITLYLFVNGPYSNIQSPQGKISAKIGTKQW